MEKTHKTEQEQREDSAFTVSPLVDVLATLRAPGGCPWDRKQTHQSLKQYLIEESYEVLEAIDEGNDDHLREELGDLLLQIVFHARLAEEDGSFTMQDVIDDCTAKMVRRHPHVFSTATAETVGEVLVNWEEIKKKEKDKKNRMILDGIPKELPALMRAQKMQEKVSKVGFDWETIDPVWAKFYEEIEEFKEAISKKNRENVVLEGGDMLFALINLLRWYKISGENALNLANSKFQRRFNHVETRVREKDIPWSELSIEELDELWDEAKMQD